jgi:hypothetical protein
LWPAIDAIAYFADRAYACVVIGLRAQNAGLLNISKVEFMSFAAFVGYPHFKLFSQLLWNIWTMLAMEIELTLWHQNSFTVGARTLKLNLFKEKIFQLLWTWEASIITVSTVFTFFKSTTLAKVFLAESLALEDFIVDLVTNATLVFLEYTLVLYVVLGC